MPLVPFVTCSCPAGRFALCGNEDKDASLAALLRIFKNYYPEIALGGPAKGPVATFKVGNTVVEPQQSDRLTPPVSKP